MKNDKFKRLLDKSPYFKDSGPVFKPKMKCPMTQALRWLYLPIDVKVREFEAKAWLALKAAQRGYNVVIGQKIKFPSILSCYPPGFYVGFGAMENFRDEYIRFRRKGHHIVIMDEEGLVTHNDTLYKQMRLNPEILDLCEVFVTWGQKQSDFIDKHQPMASGKVCTAGNPRFDVLRPELRELYADEVVRLKKLYGDFILINSNFGSANHFSGAENYLQSLRTKKVIQTEADLDYFQRYFAYRNKIMTALLQAIPALRAAFPDHSIVIRPHPSERRETWIEKTANIANLHVVHEGSAIPWILAADAMIHNFCTTALEAFALGKAPIAYRPIIDETLETALPSLASIETYDENSLVENVRAILGDGTDPKRQEKTETLGQWIANLDGSYAADTLLGRLDMLSTRDRNSYQVAALKHGLRKTAERILQKNRKNLVYTAHKFEGLDIGEIKNIARKLGKQPEEFSYIPMKMIHDNCILLEGTPGSR